MLGASRGKPISNGELVEGLCEISPVLREFRRVHVENFGTLVPHVFMGDVLAHLGMCMLDARERGAAPGPEVAAILQVLDLGMAQGDRETRNVISVSFVGDGELEPFFAHLKPWLGPRVRAQLQGR